MSAVNDIVSSLILAQINSGSGGKVKPITITENGTYNVSDAEKAEGYVGFAPVMVDVPQQGGGKSLADIVAMPTFASIEFGEFKAEFKAAVSEGRTNAAIGYPPTTSYQKKVVISSGCLQIAKVISKNGEALYGELNSTEGGVAHTKTYRYKNNADATQGVYLYMDFVCALTGTGSAEVYNYTDGGLAKIYIDMTYVETVYNIDGSIKSTDEHSSHAQMPICNVCASYYDYAAEFLSNLSDDSLAAAVVEASKAFYDTYKK